MTNNIIRKQKRHSGFRRGVGCFNCEVCGKLTRSRDSNILLCAKCEKQALKDMEEENE